MLGDNTQHPSGWHVGCFVLFNIQISVLFYHFCDGKMPAKKTAFTSFVQCQISLFIFENPSVLSQFSSLTSLSALLYFHSSLFLSVANKFPFENILLLTPTSTSELAKKCRLFICLQNYFQRYALCTNQFMQCVYKRKLGWCQAISWLNGDQ